MKFARRTLARFSTLKHDRQESRPSRALRPTLRLERCEERTLLSVTLVGSSVAGIVNANDGTDFVTTSGNSGEFYFPATQSGPDALSADGTKLVFVSDVTGVTNSVANTSEASEVFVGDSATGQRSLVSVTPDGQPGNGDSFDPVISPNGRYVAFLSMATNLTTAGQTPVGGMTFVPNPPAVADLYIRDLQTQTTTLLDQTPIGQPSDGFSTGQFIFSPDSSTLAWVDTSDNLTTATLDPLSRPTNAGERPTYVYTFDTATQTTSLVSISTTGQASGNFAESITDLVFSPDSKSLVFGSSATDLTADPTDNSTNIAVSLEGLNPENLFLRDLAAGTTTLLSVTANGRLDVDGVNLGPVFSPDGNSVAFTSDVTDLTANGTDFTLPTSLNAWSSDPAPLPDNVFVRDLTTATTTLVTATPDGLQSSGLAGDLVFSPDGSELAFTSSATDLTGNPVDSTPPPDSSDFAPGGQFGAIVDNVFVRNLSTGTITPVTVTPDGMLSSETVFNQLVFSPNGQYLAYSSDAGDLTTNSFETTPPSIPGGSYSNDSGPWPGMIANVFISNLKTGATTLASPTTNGQLSNAAAGALIFSPDGTSLFYTSNAIDLTSNPPDTSVASVLAEIFSGTNLFDYDLAAGTTSLISATSGGQLSNSMSMNAFLSSDGQTLYFDSNASDMTSSGSNPNQSTEIYSASAPFVAASQFQFQSWETAATEQGGPVVVTVLRSGTATAAASVNYSVQSGTAQAGTDFTATSGTLNFAAGQTAQTFTVPLAAGDDFNGTRSAELVLSNPQGASLGYPSAVLDLTANPPPVVTPVVTPITTPITTPVSKPKATSPAPSTSVPTPVAPTITSVVPVKARKGITKLVITFDQALDPAAAANVASYGVSIPGHKHAKHRNAVAARTAIGVASATYNAVEHQVTLTLDKKLHQKKGIQVKIQGM
jgi:Calx-beta domain/WD40-like Beta Propeller Repeat